MSEKKEDKKSSLQLIKQITIKLLNLLEIDQPTVQLTEDDNQAVQVEIDCSDLGVLIGRQGRTISNLQLVLSLLVYAKLGEWKQLVVNVGDWREKRKEALERLAFNTAQKVKFSGKEVALTGFNPAERRLIHLALIDHPDIETESRGEGKERKLYIKPKQ